MANSERIESAGENPPPQPTAGGFRPESELPLFKSPPLSPAGVAPADGIAPPSIEIITVPEPPRVRFKMPALRMPDWKLSELPRLRLGNFKLPQLPPVNIPHVALPHFAGKLTRRRKHYAVLAVTMMLAAGLGAVIGAAASGGLSRPPAQNVVGLQEQKTMQQTIARLTKDINALKANIASAGKIGHSHVAVTSDKVVVKLAARSAEKVVEKSASKTAETPVQQSDKDITGSIPSTPLPPPRPLVAESAERSPVVKDWSIRFVRDGYVYVQGRGDVYEVALGAPLPGLGPVKSIKQQDGRWVVATPKGLIVSQRDRKFFE